jgi:hypothetical protein
MLVKKGARKALVATGPGGNHIEVRADRAVAVVLFGGRPNDVQAKNMDKFVKSNYGLPGARGAKPAQVESVGLELRRSIDASSREHNEFDIVRDIITAAKALERDVAEEKAVALTLHGNENGIARTYHLIAGGDVELENVLDSNAMGAVMDFKFHLESLQRELHGCEELLSQALAHGDQEQIADARHKVSNTQGRIEEYKHKRVLGKSPAMYELLVHAAEALEGANVGFVELQACNVGFGADSGFGRFSFDSRFEELLSTKKHRVVVRTHKALICTGRPKFKTKGLAVWLGDEMDRDRESLTDLPRF